MSSITVFNQKPVMGQVAEVAGAATPLVVRLALGAFPPPPPPARDVGRQIALGSPGLPIPPLAKDIGRQVALGSPGSPFDD